MDEDGDGDGDETEENGVALKGAFLSLDPAPVGWAEHNKVSGSARSIEGR